MSPDKVPTLVAQRLTRPCPTLTNENKINEVLYLLKYLSKSYHMNEQITTS